MLRPDPARRGGGDPARATGRRSWPAAIRRTLRAAAADSSAGSLGLRLHLRDQRLFPRRRARHARGHVRLRLPRAAPGDLFQGHGARLRGHRASRSASAAIRSSRRPSRNWRWCSAAAGRIVGYTLANDVSAWDIERENALYLPQSKVYDALLRAGPGDRDGGRAARSLHARDDVHDRRATGRRSSRAARRRRGCTAGSRR